MARIDVATARAVAAWVRAEAEDKDYGAACEWRNVADAIEGEAEDQGWRCDDCRCLNALHEVFCWRCGAGQPESPAPVMPMPSSATERRHELASERGEGEWE